MGDRPVYIIAESHDHFLEYCRNNNLKGARYLRHPPQLRAILNVTILKIGRWGRSPLFNYPESERRLADIEKRKKEFGLEP